MARRVSIALILLGASLLAIGVAIHAGQRSIVTRFTVSPEAGGSAEHSFEPSRSQVHEIELEVLLDALDEEAFAAVWAKKTPSPIDLQWEVVTATGSTVARGDCREFLYFPRWSGRWDRLLDIVLRREDHRSLRAGTIARGVGSFRAEEGSAYTLRVSTGHIPDGVAAAAPRMVIRLQRAIARSQRAGPDHLVDLGGLALLAGCTLAGLVALRRRRNTSRLP